MLPRTTRASRWWCSWSKEPAGARRRQSRRKSSGARCYNPAMKTTRRRMLLSSTAALAAGAARAETRRGPRTYAWMPKLSENLADVNPPTLRWLKQLGCRHVIFQGTDQVDPDNKGYWT